MLAYLLGFALGNKFNEQDIDYRKVDIKNVETLLVSAKLTQHPERYILTQKDADSVKPPKGQKHSPEVIELINSKIEGCCLTTMEAKMIVRELKSYRESMK